MAGKFINTNYKDTMDSIVSVHDDLLKNPLYLFNDKKGTKVKYYNINTEKTTLDKGSGLAYSHLGDNSPIRFNIIYDLFLYQFAKAELSLENGDFGLEGNAISGESFILPNVFTPTDGDYFEVYHIKDSSWLFRVNDVQRDTLENGNNVFKIGWSLDRTTNKDILNNVVEEYQYVDVQDGTNTKAVVKLEKYKIAEKLDAMSCTLRDYFKELFYNDKVQTFIYPLYNNSNMYDPFAIEFIKRNRLLYDTGRDFTYIDHKIKPSATFSIEYNKTFFRAFEQRDIIKLRSSVYISQAKVIDSPASVFGSRYENYFALDYSVFMLDDGTPFNPTLIINLMDEELVERIYCNKKYDDKENSYKNIIIKYFNKEDVLQSDIDAMEMIDLQQVKDIFYQLLLLIFCIDFYTKMLLV